MSKVQHNKSIPSTSMSTQRPDVASLKLFLEDKAPLEFLLTCAHLMRLPQVTISTAVQYFHRYRAFTRSPTPAVPSGHVTADMMMRMQEEKDWKLDPHLLVTTCLHLSCKTTEVTRKIRDVLNVGIWVLFRGTKEEYMDIKDQKYLELRDSLVKSELILLRVLRFEMDVETPFPWIMTIVEKMKKHLHPSFPIRDLSQLAFTFASDACLSSDISIRHSALQIAMACLYLASRALNVGLPISSLDSWCAKWEGITAESLRHTITTIITFFELYETKKDHDKYKINGMSNSQ